MIFTDLLTVARKVNNYEIDATGGILWSSTTLFKCVVPTGKRWFVIGGVCYKDVSADMYVNAYDTDDNIICQIDYHTASAAVETWPCTLYAVGTKGNSGIPVILDAGEYVGIVCGIAQSTTAYASCMVLEVNI